MAIHDASISGLFLDCTSNLAHKHNSRTIIAFFMHQRLLVVPPNHHHNVCERRLERKKRRRNPKRCIFVQEKVCNMQIGIVCGWKRGNEKKSEINTKIWKFRPTWPINFQRNGSLFISIGLADSALSRHLSNWIVSRHAIATSSVSSIPLFAPLCHRLPSQIINLLAMSGVCHTQTHTHALCMLVHDSSAGVFGCQE